MEPKLLNRPCPHCKAKMDVFDEACPACGKPSKACALHGIAAIIYGHRSLLFIAALLVVSWFVLSWLFKIFKL